MTESAVRRFIEGDNLNSLVQESEDVNINSNWREGIGFYLIPIVIISMILILFSKKI